MEQLIFPFTKPGDYSASSFVVTSSNRLAHDYLKMWPKWPAFGAIVQGPSHSGKTHLAHLWKEQSSARFLTKEGFEALQEEGDFSAQSTWIIDGLEQFLPNYETTLFHLFNGLRQIGGSLLITMTAPFSSIPVNLPDLKSRLSVLPVLKIGDPDDVLFMTILSKEFSDRQVRIDHKVLDFIVRQVPRTFESLKTIPETLSLRSLQERHEVTIPFVKTALGL